MFELRLLPPSTQRVVDGYVASPATDGESGATVHRLEAPGRPSLYLKCGDGDVREAITGEMTRLAWLAGRVAIPTVVHFERSRHSAYLVTTALDGRSAYDLLTTEPSQRVRVAQSLARFLKSWHALPAAACPFEAGDELRLAEARRRLDAGLVDEDDFDEARAGWSATRVWVAMLALRPLTRERVVTHGDFSLGNVFLGAHDAVGAIDVGRTGVADRYQDLAICWRDLGEFGAEVQDAFLAAYGIDVPDAQRLHFHLHLDEFF